MISAAVHIHHEHHEHHEHHDREEKPQSASASAFRRASARLQRLQSIARVNGVIEAWRSQHFFFRDHVYMTLEDPGSSETAARVSVLLWCVVLLSVLATCLETVPAYEHWPHWKFVELIFNLIFSTELLLRFWSAPSLRFIWLDPMTFVDILAVLPWYLQLFLKRSERSLEVVSFLRSLRMLKLLRQYDGSILLMQVLAISKEALILPLFFLAVLVIVFSSGFYGIELGENEKVTSIPGACWFMVVTLTTVGYGDVYPATPTGKIFIVVVMISGLLFMSMPLAIVGNNFVSVWESKDRVVLVFRLKKYFLKKGCTHEAIRKAFEEADLDNSGSVSYGEFNAALRRMQINLPVRKVDRLFEMIDEDNSGCINYDEFVKLLNSSGVTAEGSPEAGDGSKGEVKGAEGAEAEPTTETRTVLETQERELLQHVQKLEGGVNEDLQALASRLEQMEQTQKKNSATMSAQLGARSEMLAKMSEGLQPLLLAARK